ncbi:hypothetical protein MY4824_009356 [Beauveria thailandica]
MVQSRPICLLIGALLSIIPLFASSTCAALVQKSLTFTWENGAPNGQGRDMILTNGQFPSPLLVFDEGDDVEITVNNDMHENTTVHWHGIDQRESPWSDGVPGLSQTPIEPGESYIYRFKAYPPGQHWYHSHSRATLLDGLYGPLLVRRKKRTANPFHLISKDPEDIRAMERAAHDPKVMLVSDWSNFNSSRVLEATAKSKLQIFCVDSVLINGKGNLHCPGQQWFTDMQIPFMQRSWPNDTISDKGCFPFVPSTEGPWLPEGNTSHIPYGMQDGCMASTGQKEIIEVDANQQRWLSINWIGASTFKTLQPSIDEHEMWIYEVDGHYIEPRKATTMLLWAGERYCAMVRLDQRKMDYAIRVIDGGYSQMIGEFATLRYAGGEIDLAEPDRFGVTTISRPWFGYNAWPIGKPTFLDKNDLPPFPPTPPARLSDETHILMLGKANSTWEFTLGGKKKYPEDHSAYKPLLEHLDSAEANDDDLMIRTKNGTWQDIILQVGHSKLWPVEFPHAIHKHANKYWRIGSGMGMFSYPTVNEAIEAQPELFNLENPPYRDTFLNEFTGTMWVALRYQVTHPGAWLLHCHFETHLSNGMAMAILDGVDVWPVVPEEYANNGKGVLGAGSTGQKAENEPATASEPAADKQESLPKFRPETAWADGQAVITYVGVATLALALAMLGWCKGVLSFGRSSDKSKSSILQLEEVQNLLGQEREAATKTPKRKKESLKDS